MAEPSGRRAYLDWLRGLAVLIMVEAHVIDAWTRVADRTGRAYYWSIVLAGLAAPLFLFLAGLAAVLSAESKTRRSGDAAAAADAVRRRGWEIFGLAFLFRLQAMVLSLGRPSHLLKVDILNIMGPSIVAVAALWHLARSRAARLAVFAVAAAVVALCTPLVRATSWLASLPDPLEWYLRPPAGRQWFSVFPWLAFPLAGAVVGLLIDVTRDRRRERLVMAGLAAGGAALWTAAYWRSLVPGLFDDPLVWSASAAFFSLRLGLVVFLVPAAWLLGRSRQLEELGKSSLFVYWIHVEMAYGLISYPLHRTLPLVWSWIGLALLSLLLYRLVLLKNRLVPPWRARRRANSIAGRVADAVLG
jgi:uncharacterized membrane protein